jgi:Tol biopolymer transport system component
MLTPALNNYGLGVSIDSEGGRTKIWHTGSLDGFNTSLAFYPESQVVVVGLSNLADTGVRDISRELAALAHGERAVTRRGMKSVVWLDREGNRLDRGTALRGAYEGLALDPEGGRLALTVWRGGDNWDVQVWDPADGVMSEVAADPEYDGFPVWSPNGEELAFSSGVPRQVYRKSFRGDAGAQRLTDGSRPPKFVLDWSSDGSNLLYRERDPEGGWDLITLPLKGDRTPQPLVRTNGLGKLSPDGRYLLYSADNSGRIELYLQELPKTAEVNPTAQLITADGGYDIHWRADGSELYYCRPDDGAVMIVGFQRTESGLTASAPRLLFSYGPNAGFDVTPDGQQFVLLVAPAGVE